jgi:ketosteroid isomerase-like protein
MKLFEPGETTLLDATALADRAAIHDVIAAFALLFDSGGFAAMGELFTEDACYELNPPPDGLPATISTREQIVAGMTSLWQHNRETVGVYQRHVTTDLLVTRLGVDAAEAHSVLTVTGAYADGRLEFRRAGNYVDQLRKEGSRWRISHRTLFLAAPPPIF